MSWGSVDAFLAMGGYGFYVWGSYGVMALALLVEMAGLRARLRAGRAFEKEST
jgi:heme exporter protein D